MPRFEELTPEKLGKVHLDPFLSANNFFFFIIIYFVGVGS